MGEIEGTEMERISQEKGAGEGKRQQKMEQARSLKVFTFIIQLLLQTKITQKGQDPVHYLKRDHNFKLNIYREPPLVVKANNHNKNCMSSRPTSEFLNPELFTESILLSREQMIAHFSLQVSFVKKRDIRAETMKPTQLWRC